MTRVTNKLNMPWPIIPAASRPVRWAT
jgi:hypothetical protein